VQAQALVLQVTALLGLVSHLHLPTSPGCLLLLLLLLLLLVLPLLRLLMVQVLQLHLHRPAGLPTHPRPLVTPGAPGQHLQADDHDRSF
jgi:hypothetical protein